MTEFIASPMFARWFLRHPPQRSLLLCSPFLRGGTLERVLELPQAALDSRGVSPTFTQVADGVWAAPSTVVPGAPNDAAYSLVFWCQGYDDHGNLVCSYDLMEHLM